MRRVSRLIIMGIIFGLLLSPLIFFTYPQFIIFPNLSNLSVLMVILSTVLLLFTSILLFGWIKERKHLRLSRRARKDVELQLQDEQNRFEVIFHHTNIGIALLDMNGKFIKVNELICELFGYHEDELLALNFFSFIENTQLNNFKIHLQGLLDRKIKTYHSEHQCYRKNGETIWIMASLSLIYEKKNKPDSGYYILQVQNISLQKKAEERLRHMAYHDPLTGLANRNKLEQFIAHSLAVARRHQYGFGLLFLDLDRFKNINDTIGHEAGDTLLQIVAERLRSAVRNTDMVARLGGDEFVLLITDVKKTESVAIIAQKILENILKVVVINGHEIYITTSVGISLYPHDGQNMQSLMKNADLALYRAKEHGRNNYQFYTIEMTSRAQQKLSLQTALGHALVKNEFLLNYQPKMQIQSRQITGIEALLRWKNNEYKMITPDEIISLAEETGLIIPVSEWIIKTACQQLRAWHDTGLTSLTMAINCSSRQFKQSTFVNELIDIIKHHNLSPQCIEIEITEAMIMQDPENILRILYALKDMGVKIVIDDFGTGYWSLSNLRRLSVDKIKIDKSFIKQSVIDEASATITKAIIAMINKLGIISIAEGVETREQYEFLKQEGCIEIQGYYLTHPLNSEGMTQFLRHPLPEAEVANNSLSPETRK